MFTRERWLVISCSVMLAACGSDHPTAPSTSNATPLTLTVKGATAISVGQMVQYSAITNVGEDVATLAVWQSSETFARISTSGLVTAIAPGATILTASYKGTKATLTIAVGSVTLPPTITSCGNIVTPGSYVVVSDISQLIASGSCLQVQASAVHLDCGGHFVSGVRVDHTSNVTVTNCVVPYAPQASTIFVDHSTNVTISHNTLATMTAIGGEFNQILQNTIDGGYDGSTNNVGQDDGIVLIDEANDTIQGNTIRNVFDAGIEGVDVVMNTIITGNTIDNTRTAGISSYWCTSWTGNTISGNSVSRSSTVVVFAYQVGVSKCVNTATVGTFSNNQMVGNRLTSQKFPGPAMYFDLNKTGVVSVVNNLIQGNDLGAAEGPSMNPLAGFINGGGNTCAAFSSPFCGGLTLTAIHLPDRFRGLYSSPRIFHTLSPLRPL